MLGLAGLSWFWMWLACGVGCYCWGFGWIVWFAAGFTMCVPVVFLVFRCLIAFGFLGCCLVWVGFCHGWWVVWYWSVLLDVVIWCGNDVIYISEVS